MNNTLLFTRRHAVAIISINDAPVNRMTLEFIDELETLVEDIAADDAIRAVVLTAEGLENFSVGMNLKQLPEGMQRPGGADALFDQRLKVIGAIENMGKPWVATMFGYCLAGGLELPLGSEDRSLDELLRAERAAVHKTSGSPDQIEGMMAFLEKRKPAFNQSDA